MNKIRTFSFAIMMLLFACRSQQETGLEFNYRIIDSSAIALRAIADFSGDGKNDILAIFGDEAGGSRFPATMAVYEFPHFTKHTIADTSDLEYIADLEIADLDGDGDIDAVFPDSKSPDYLRVYWLVNPAPTYNPLEKSWERRTIFESLEDEHFKDVALVDINLDKKTDIVVRLEAGLVILLQDDSLRFTEQRIKNLPEREGMDAGDIDGDGYPDVALNGYWLKNPGNSGKDWILQDIDSIWYTQNTGMWMDNSCRVCIADVNNDKKNDVILSQSENKGFPVTWYTLVDAENNEWEKQVIGNTDYCHTLQAGDVDNDGDLDILAAKLPRWDTLGPVLIYLNKGKGMDWEELILSKEKGAYIGILGDVGSDGDLDVVSCRSFNWAPVEMWENKLYD